MKPVSWFAAGFGTCLGITTLAAIAVDVAFVEHGIPTISQRSITAATDYPGIAAAASGVLCLVVGMLVGHLFLGQTKPQPKVPQ